MWLGVIGMGPAMLVPLLPERFTSYETLQREPSYLAAFSAARRSVAIATSFLVTVAFLLTWRLFGAGPAIASGVLLTLDPYVIGMTRLLHVDALLAPLMLVSVLAGLVYWTVTPRWQYLVLSAVAGGLALLTKAPAGFLALFMGLVALTSVAVAGRSPQRDARRTAGAMLGWGLVAALTYLALFPALWVDLLGRGQQLVTFVRAVGLEPHNGNYFLGQPVMDDPGPLYYLVALPLRLSPLVVLGVALLVLTARASDNRPAVRWLVVYVIVFAVLMSVASKKFDRYMLPAIMALDVMAGIGVWRLARLLARRRAAIVVGTVLAAGQILLLARVWPYPIAYYNPLAGGPDRARDLIMIGWGEGLEQVTDFLATLANRDQLLVLTSYNNVVRPGFEGRTLPIAPYIRGGRDLPRPDYVVLYINAVQRRQSSPEIALAQATGPPVFVARVNGLEYAWVYYLPPIGPRPAVAPALEESVEGEEN
jgi:hypothetical protein